MDNDMIVDFINKVEPDFSYGTSDGMTRAMVESAENLASVNEYITESMYEVYGESYNAYIESDDSNSKPDKPGFFGKISNKIDTYFQLFMRIINKFITKIKGFFMTVKRKLTMAFAKAIKAVGNFLRNRITNNRKKFDKTDEDEKIEIYIWNDKTYSNLIGGSWYNALDIPTTFNGDGNDYNTAQEKIETIKNTISDIAVSKSDATDSDTITLLDTGKTSFDPNTTTKFLQNKYRANVESKLNAVYNKIMKQSAETIKQLKTLEKDIRKEFKKSSNKDNETRRIAKDKFKAVNYLINQASLIKYRVAQKVASACFKYYKKLFSAVRKVFGGFNIFGKSGDYNEPETKDTSTGTKVPDTK